MKTPINRVGREPNKNRKPLFKTSLLTDILET